MLNLKRFGGRLQRKNEFPRTGSYRQWFIDATDQLDAKERLRLLHGIEWEVIEVWGPIENLPVDQS